MFWNKEKKQVYKLLDCLSCPYFDKSKKKCVGGIGKNCFEYDPKTHTAIDPKTRLPIKLD